MRRILIGILILMIAFGMAGAARYPGGFFSGDLNMSGNDITNVSSITVTGVVTAGGGTTNGGIYDGNFWINGAHTFGVNGGAATFGAALTAASLKSNATAIVAGRSYLNATQGTTIYASSTLGAAGVTALNATTLTTLDASGTADIAGALTTTTTAKIGGMATVANLYDNGTEVIVGSSYLNSTTIDTGDTLAVTSADKLTVAGVIVPQAITIPVPLNAASVNGTVFIPISGNYEVVGVSIGYNAASTGPGAGTVNIIKCTTTQDPATAGVAVLSSAPSIKGTPNTIISGTVSTIGGRAKVNTTEFLGMRFNTALTSLAGGCVSISLKRIA